ncbi:MAG: SLC13 family permease, partial [Ignavibacteria bacterium]|nr:SLC13 family permease [Ignavibacteria bacterium]
EVLVPGALILFIFGGVITAGEAFHGFSNQGMLSVGFLYVVAYALQATGVLDTVTRALFGRDKGGLRVKLNRFLFPVAGLSAFLNNTPVVSMLVPAVKSWCRQRNVPSSKFLIPLSYAAILGGTCTLIGTSSNLVVHGFLLERGLGGFSFFELAVVGVPITIVGILALSFVLHRLLPNRKEAITELDENTRDFVIQMKVSEKYVEVGKSIEAAGLRHLQGLFLFQIERNGDVIAPVQPNEKVRVNDRLFFTGLPSTIVELQKHRGLDVIKDAHFDLKNYDSSELKTYEVVVSPSSPLVGKTVRKSNFRRIYDAVILAIHRSGERIDSKVGDIKFRAGDTLLILSHREFYDHWYHSRDFSLVSTSDEVPSKRRSQAVIALGITLAMVVSVALDLLPLVVAAGSAAILLILTRCISSLDAFSGVDWKILLVIASAFGIAKALENAGVAQYFATRIVSLSAPIGILALIASIYFATLIMREIVSNNAAAAIMFPVAVSIASQSTHDLMPFAYAVVIGASAGFATPIGYATNLMVFGPGGYRFKDYLKVGIPMDLIVGAVAVSIIYFHFF